MTWRQYLLIGLAVISLLVASGVVFISQKVDQFIVDQGSAGAFLAARQATRMNDAQAAGDYWQMALMARPENEELLTSAMQSKILAGDMDGALDLATRLITVRPNHQQAHILLATRAFRQSQYDKALAHVEDMPAGPLASLLGPNMELWIARANGDEALGSSAVKRMSRASAFAAVPLVQAAHVLELNGNIEAARAHYLDAVKAGAARYLHFILAYGGFLERQGDTQKAGKLYAFYQAGHIEHPHVSEAQARLERDDMPTLETDPKAGLAMAFAAIGEAMEVESRFDLALGYYRLADYLYDENDLVDFSLGLMLSERGRVLKAAEQFDTIPQNALLYREGQIQRAQALFEADAGEAAIAVLSKQLKRFPDDRDVLVSLGDLYRASERFSEAEEMYDRAVGLIDEDSPRDWHLYFVRGMMRERLDNWDMAESDLQRARKLSGDEPHVLNYLGYSWIDQGLYLEEGLRIIRQAVKKQPKNGAFVDSLGWAHFRLGNYPKALDLLERATLLEPTDPVITDHLGDALWRNGREVEARYQWRKALAFDPTPEDRIKIEGKLLKGLGPPEPEKPEARMPRGGTAI